MKRRTWSLLTLIAAVLMLATIGAGGASAQVCATFANEDEQRNYAGPCRGFDVVDPGVGNLLSRAQMIHARDTYLNNGVRRVPMGFLWYSPERQITLAGDDQQRWSFCDQASNGGGACAPDRVRASTFRILDNFTAASVVLNVFGDASGFVARVCGNIDEDGNFDTAPTVSGLKYHDLNANGVRDAGEPPLAGFTFTLTRTEDRPVAGEPLGPAQATAVSGADGRYSFRLSEMGPGVYRVRESAPAGWRQTSADPAPFVVNPGIGNAELAGGDVGNIRQADVQKLGMVFLDPPAEIEADEPTQLTLRAQIRNNGPAGPVDVIDRFTLTGLFDCRIEPAVREVRRTLAAGETATVDATFTVDCADPSFHRFVGANSLRLDTPGVEDPNAANNTGGAETTIPVFDRTDLRVDPVSVDCPARIDVDTSFTCTVSAPVANLGPYGPTDASVSIGLTAPADCEVTPRGADPQALQIAVGASPVLSRAFDITCADRSFHPVRGTVAAEVVHLHVRDPQPANNAATGSDVVEVFEEADMAVTDLRIVCDEAVAGRSFTCVVDAAIANAGPADAVVTRTSTTIAAPADCTVDPAGAQSAVRTLATGGTDVVHTTWALDCALGTPHEVRARASITNDPSDPHAEDRAEGDNARVRLWVRSDIKPNSDPNSINLKRGGMVAVAILSTPDLDAPSAVDPATVTYGPTGTEAPAVRCATGGEDVNADGLRDLVCHFENRETGFAVGDTIGEIRGLLFDGTPFMSQDAVRIIA